MEQHLRKNDRKIGHKKKKKSIQTSTGSSLCAVNLEFRRQITPCIAEEVSPWLKGGYKQTNKQKKQRPLLLACVTRAIREDYSLSQA